MDDYELLMRWREGDAAAGQTLVDKHFNSLRRFFASKVSREVEDLVQQTFLGCVENQARIREGSFRSYLFGVARRQLYTHFRKMGARDIEFGVSSVMDLGASPSVMLAEREQEQALVIALQKMPIDLQITLELTFWENMTAFEVSEVLGIPENTVYSRIRRAKEELRDALRHLHLPGIAPRP